MKLYKHKQSIYMMNSIMNNSTMMNFVRYNHLVKSSIYSIYSIHASFKRPFKRTFSSGDDNNTDFMGTINERYLEREREKYLKFLEKNKATEIEIDVHLKLKFNETLNPNIISKIIYKTKPYKANIPEIRDTINNNEYIYHDCLVLWHSKKNSILSVYSTNKNNIMHLLHPELIHNINNTIQCINKMDIEVINVYERKYLIRIASYTRLF